MSAPCSVHGKNRTLQNLEPDGSGGFRCLAGSRCQQTGEKRGNVDMTQMNQMMGMMQMMMAAQSRGGGKKARQIPETGVVICSVHGKQRSAKSMQADGSGGMCCAPGYECQLGAIDSSGSKKGAAGVVQICSIHGKKRSPQSLVSDGSGGMCCAPGMTCQLKSTDADASDAVEQFECSKHGKMRSLQSLEEDGEGGYKCAPGMQCQIGGGRGKAGGSKMSQGMMNPMMMMMMQQMQQMSKGGKGKNLKPKGSMSCKWCMQGECWTHV